MKRSVQFLLSLAILTLALTHTDVRAQFRAPSLNGDGSDQPKPTIEAMTGGTDFFSQLLDPARWSTHSMYSFSYTNFAGNSVGLGMYTQTLQYMASDNVRFSADVSAVYSPFSSFGSAYSKSLSGIYLSDARLDWKLGDQTFLMIQYIGGPGPNSMPYYLPGYSHY